MQSIGIHPHFESKPFMLERFARDNNLQRVQGKHLHMCSSTVKNPRVVPIVKKPARIARNWTPGGNAA